VKELGGEIRNIVEGSARFWDTALVGLRDVHLPSRHSGATRVKSDAEIQMDVLRWFRHWRETASARMCALLIAGYFRTRGPFGVEGEEKYLQLRQPHGLAFLELVEESADRALTFRDYEIAAQEGGEALRLFRRDAISADMTWQFDPQTIVNYLRLALSRPRRAAARLILQDATDEDEPWHDRTPSYPALQQVRECFCPANWLAAPPAWTPPAEAASWAQRIYDQRAFGELPILADLLEDADCPDRPLLDHCRNCQAHFRGCAALDRLLGKA
jgi:hypothetical protein